MKKKALEEMTLEEMEAELEVGKKVLGEMYESGNYTKEEILKKSQEIDPLVTQLMRVKKIDEMIKNYNLVLNEGEIVVGGSWLIIGNQGDFKFFKENKSAFLKRIREIEAKNDDEDER